MNNLKKVLIGGPARSGKTKLARKLSQRIGCSHIPLDALVTSFEEHFPDTGIRHEGSDWDSICSSFLPFLTTFLHELSFEGASFVCDTYHIRPRAAAELCKSQGLTVVFFGYPAVDEAIKLDSIRKFREPQDWTDAISDDELRVLTQKFKAESIRIQAECAEYGIPFFDTGANFDRALSEAFDWLVANA